MLTDISHRGRCFLRRQQNAAIWEMPEIKIAWYRDEASDAWMDKRKRLARRDLMRPKRAAWYLKRVTQASRWYHRVWGDYANKQP